MGDLTMANSSSPSSSPAAGDGGGAAGAVMAGDAATAAGATATICGGATVRCPAVLLDADLEVLVRELELGELVLAHHGEYLVDLLEVHRPRWLGLAPSERSVDDERARHARQDVPRRTP